MGLLLSVAVSPNLAHADWVSPGPLSRGHAELDRQNRCEQCHLKGKGVAKRRCLNCHTRVAGPLARGKGFHAQLIKRSNKRCEDCHHEHKGRSFPLIRWSPPKDFDHGNKTGFTLEAAHARLACQTCHKRRPSYMGATSKCAACHTDPHRKRLGTHCQDCHTQKSFSPASRFKHGKTDFPLTGKHQRLRCVQCHKPSGGAKLPDFSVKTFRRCSACHQDPHRGRTSLSACSACHTTDGFAKTNDAVPPAHSPAGYPLVGKHAAVSCKDCHGSRLTAKVSRSCATCHPDRHQGRLGNRCEQCHNEGGWQTSAARASKVYDHTKTGFALTGKHRRTACSKCHGPALDKRVKQRCVSCHKDAHASRFGDQCQSCHNPSGWKDIRKAGFSHDKTRFPLRGRHRQVACQKCHRPAQKGLTQYRGLRFESCDRCHKQHHPEHFVSVAPDSRCESCHDTSGFRVATYSPAQHDQARWPLEGSHRATPCQACHKPDSKGVTNLSLEDRRCVSCHEDRHEGQFDARMVDGRGCEMCHNKQMWTNERFDHGSTHFPLEGPHKKVACASCHADGQYRGVSTACAGCHVDPHLGQFGAPPEAGAKAKTLTGRVGRACKSCHDGRVWQINPFDHQKLAGWALDGKHAPLKCQRCHTKIQFERGLEAVQYRLGSHDCQRCHQNPHRRAP